MASLKGTYIFDFPQSQTADAAKIQLRNTPNHPVRLHVRPMLQWRREGSGAMVAVNDSNRCRDNVSIPNRNVASWTTVDVQASCDPLNASLVDRLLRDSLNLSRSVCQRGYNGGGAAVFRYSRARAWFISVSPIGYAPRPPS